MNNFIFKSANRLIKNSSVDLDNLLLDMSKHLGFVLREQRHQRSDLQDIKLMINKLLIDKHLQMQVDEYFEDDEHSPEKPPVEDLD